MRVRCLTAFGGRLRIGLLSLHLASQPSCIMTAREGAQHSGIVDASPIREGVTGKKLDHGTPVVDARESMSMSRSIKLK
ncbi:hypothetical protein Pan216_07130 [Planctomycetes bacterium Pan216]|uniref:Uncharacterized protein n=1 Tax=Kolteria novifilia TaxID=2527975 RepID=A0A518AYW2_9BACT|nr:hypothetical protein Pan216_07130 [Planctomycetes bacterium Pan216]